MSPTWKAAIGVIVVFILGWVGGAVTTIVVARHKALEIMQGGPETMAIVLERRTTRNLGLTPDQRDRLHAVFVNYVSQRLELQKQIQPQVKTVNAQTLQAIDAVLTPDQQQHFHDNLVLFKERYGRNPFNVGADKPVPPANPDSVGASATAPATNTPAATN